MAHYNIKDWDVAAVSNDYLKYGNDVSGACDELNTRIASLAGLASFQGAAADQIKGYFQRHHAMILSSLELLVQELGTEYATLFASRFADAPVSEPVGDGHAQWPKDVLRSGIAFLEKMGGDGYLETAEDCLRRAECALPGDVQIQRPSSNALRNKIEEGIQETTNVRDAISEIDDGATSGFKGDTGNFASLASALSAIIARSDSMSMVTYDGDGISSTAEFKKLRAAYNDCAEYQNEHYDLTAASQARALSVEQAYVDEETRRAAEEKAKWAILGTVASVVVLVGAGMATVATLGSGAPVMVVALGTTANLIGMGTAAEDLYARKEQLLDMASGDWGADKDGLDEVYKDEAKVAKTGLKYGSKREQADIAAAKNDLDTAKSSNVKAGKTIGRFVRDEAADAYIENTFEDEGDQASAKIWYEAGSEAVDSVIDYGFGGEDFGLGGGAGVVGTVGKMGTIWADYKTDQADQRLDELSERSEELDGIRASGGPRRAAAWSFG